MARKTRPAKRLPCRGAWLFASATLVVLLASTVLWAVLGARLQLQNADQLVSPYMFSDVATFQGATFPTAHTFLLKWPVFWLVALYGVTPTAVLVATVACVLVTVAGLAVLLWRIERRPRVLGLLYLALALVLLMTPYAPSAGTLLPVNVAMLTTRNVEYLVYLIGLMLVVRSTQVKGGWFIGAVAVFTLLCASDKLFIALNVGGALLGLLCYALARYSAMVGLMARWLLASLAAAALSMVTIAVLTASKITNFSGQAAGGGPYGLADSSRDLALGALFAATGFLTNLGANPLYGLRQIAHAPAVLRANLLGWAGLPTLVNLTLCLAALVVAWRLFVPGLLYHRKVGMYNGRAHGLAAMLFFATLTAAAVFVLTKHEYAVDARYMGLAVFAVFIGLAVYMRRHDISTRWSRPLVAVLLVALGLAVIANAGWYHDQARSTAELARRNQTVAQALAGRKSDVLVGDYWRVVPIRQAARDTITATPLASCTLPQAALNSKQWMPDLNKRSFAYLLTFDGSPTNFPACQLEQIIKAYGRPNASTVIAGTPDKPKELLLYYDRGKNLPPANAPAPPKPVTTVTPIGLDQLQDTHCAVPTVLNVVAHEDDDILFMNPDVYHDIKADKCVRTVYITAGDAGQNSAYWHGRMQGAQQAYNEMTGNRDLWVERTVKINDNSFITIANPRRNHKISLIFMNLPDGNTKGNGFGSSRNQSLAKLLEGKIAAIQSVDTYSSYDTASLTKALTDLMLTYQVTAVRTQADAASARHPDHSDHIATGRLARQAFDDYRQTQYGSRVELPFDRYVGYTTHDLPANLDAEDKDTKVAIFLAYAKYDPAVCFSQTACKRSSAYDVYLERQYHHP